LATGTAFALKYRKQKSVAVGMYGKKKKKEKDNKKKIFYFNTF
jgi:TPP-dependent pyruvate/acetoin dehydrogenase alpha subunit